MMLLQHQITVTILLQRQLKTKIMATSNNPLTKGLSGRMGQIVFSQRNGKTIISMRPRKSKTVSSPQSANRENFKNACIYAKSAMINTSLKQAYAARAKPGQTAYNVAFAEFYTLTVIQKIDSSAYNGREGSAVMITVADGFAIASIHVRITGKRFFSEDGPASLLPAGLGWVYVSTSENPTITDTKIHVTVTDMGGRLITKTKTL